MMDLELVPLTPTSSTVVRCSWLIMNVQPASGRPRRDLHKLFGLEAKGFLLGPPDRSLRLFTRERFDGGLGVWSEGPVHLRCHARNGRVAPRAAYTDPLLSSHVERVALFFSYFSEPSIVQNSSYN